MDVLRRGPQLIDAIPQEIRHRSPQFVTLHFELGNVRQAFLCALFGLLLFGLIIYKYAVGATTVAGFTTTASMYIIG